MYSDVDLLYLIILHVYTSLFLRLHNIPTSSCMSSVCPSDRMSVFPSVSFLLSLSLPFSICTPSFILFSNSFLFRSFYTYFNLSLSPTPFYSFFIYSLLQSIFPLSHSLCITISIHLSPLIFTRKPTLVSFPCSCRDRIYGSGMRRYLARTSL